MCYYEVCFKWSREETNNEGLQLNLDLLEERREQTLIKLRGKKRASSN